MTDHERSRSELTRTLGCAVLWSLAATAPLVAQDEWSFRDTSQSDEAAMCGDTPQDILAPDAASQAQASELASDSDQALMLGDLDRASALLARAIELDPSSPVLAYRRGRVLEDLGQGEAAAAVYCRVLAFGREDEIQTDARNRVLVLREQGTQVSDGARAAAAQAVAWAEAGDLAQALRRFDDVARDAPLWADGVYNRGVTLARMGRHAEALQAFARYLELAPTAPDALAVARHMGRLEVLIAALRETPNPYAALTLGTLFPGMGQFYSGRARGGLLVVALTGGAVLGGVFITEVNVRCQEPVGPGELCPDAAIVSRRHERPHLMQGIGLASAVVAVAAVEAFIHTRGRRSGRDPYGGRLRGPSVTDRGGGGDLNVFSIRLR